MSVLAEYKDFVLNTGPSFVHGPDDLLLEARKRGYILGYATQGDISERLQGGESIRGNILLEDGGTFSHKAPGAEHEVRMPQVEKQKKIDWRFAYDQNAWLDQTIILQANNMTQAKRFMLYNREKTKLEKRMALSMTNGMEASSWATPSRKLMLTGDAVTDATEPLSIPCFVNEETNGAYNYTETGDWSADVIGISPADEARWRPQQLTYSVSVAPTAMVASEYEGLIDQFELMCMLLAWGDVPMVDGYGANAAEFSAQSVGKKVIATVRTGVQEFKRAMRSTNALDGFATSTGGDIGRIVPLFSGALVKHFEELETARIYNDGSGNLVDWTNAGTRPNRARYTFLDFDWIYPIFHEEMYFADTETFKDGRQPDANVRYKVCYWNWWCESRQRLGHIAPVA